MEIERKFLVNANKLDLTNCKNSKLEQYYLSYSPEIRVRKKTYDNDVKCFFTYKSDGDMVRKEIEIEVSNDFYNKFKDCAKGRVISKVRYEFYLFKGLVAEVDIYEGDLNGLMVVEVEFASEIDSQDFTNNIPSWFGKEITCDRKFKNKNLSSINIDELF